MEATYGPKLNRLIEGAVEDLEDWFSEHPGDDPSYDGTIHEIADSSVPVYYSDLMDIATDSFTEVMLGETEIETDGTPMHHIQVRIYEILELELWQAYERLKAEEEDADAEWDAHWAKTDRELERVRK